MVLARKPKSFPTFSKANIKMTVSSDKNHPDAIQIERASAKAKVNLFFWSGTTKMTHTHTNSCTKVVNLWLEQFLFLFFVVYCFIFALYTLLFYAAWLLQCRTLIPCWKFQNLSFITFLPNNNNVFNFFVCVFVCVCVMSTDYFWDFMWFYAEEMKNQALTFSTVLQIEKELEMVFPYYSLLFSGLVRWICVHITLLPRLRFCSSSIYGYGLLNFLLF